ncbi:MAG: carbohydrate-binding family 9-like protein [Thermoguttaceae bacterium]|nr:carbohydrate-binding family 9-like protein [Thermoguttaceae bacterium]
MKQILRTLPIPFVLVLIAAAAPASAQVLTAEATARSPLRIPYVDCRADIDGRALEEVWKQIPPLTAFHYYWDEEPAPKTELRLFHNGDDLYFLYTVEDDDVVSARVISEEMDIAEEDRIEFGMSPEDSTAPYYFFEIDSQGRVLDYETRYYRRFDPEWDSDSLEVLGRQTETGYEVEGKFSLRELRDLGVLTSDGKLRLGCFRGEYSSDRPSGENYKWISWVHPQTAVPDFHVRSAFGAARLEESR